MKKEKTKNKQGYTAARSALQQIAGDELLQYEEGIDVEKLVKLLLKRTQPVPVQAPQAAGTPAPAKPAAQATTGATAKAPAPAPAPTPTGIQGELKLLNTLLSSDEPTKEGGNVEAVASKKVDWQATARVYQALARIALEIMGEKL